MLHKKEIKVVQITEVLTYLIANQEELKQTKPAERQRNDNFLKKFAIKIKSPDIRQKYREAVAEHQHYIRQNKVKVATFGDLIQLLAEIRKKQNEQLTQKKNHRPQELEAVSGAGQDFEELSKNNSSTLTDAQINANVVRERNEVDIPNDFNTQLAQDPQENDKSGHGHSDYPLNAGDQSSLKITVQEVEKHDNQYSDLRMELFEIIQSEINRLKKASQSCTSVGMYRKAHEISQALNRVRNCSIKVDHAEDLNQILNYKDGKNKSLREALNIQRHSIFTRSNGNSFFFNSRASSLKTVEEYIATEVSCINQL